MKRLLCDSKPMLWLFGCVCYWAAAALAAPGAHGPDGEHLDAPGAATATGLMRLPDGSVQVPKSAQRRMEIRTDMPKASAHPVTVVLNARVVADPNASAIVQSAQGGRLEAGPRGLPVVGQRVARGEVLAWVRPISDPLSVGAQRAQVAELQVERQLAADRVARLEMLADTVPRKELEAARSQVKSLEARERSVRESLSVREPLIAPIAGVIAKHDMVLGQVVEPRVVLAELLDPRRQWIEASTEDPALPSKITTASIEGQGDVRLRVQGGARILRDGMLPVLFSVSAGRAEGLAVRQWVRVLAQTGQSLDGYLLPAAAVVRAPNNEPVVWIKSGAQRFIAQPVRVQALDAQNLVVTHGLGADNRVVVRGAALIAQIR
jgi:membrane fusion protein, heavy metal efflux system